MRILIEEQKQFANDVKEFANQPKQFANIGEQFVKEFVKEFANSDKDCTKEQIEFTKEFAKARRAIYKCIERNSKITLGQMAEEINPNRSLEATVVCP